MDLCEIDRTTSPPVLRIPERFNAAHDLLERNLRAGREAKIVYIDDRGSYTYGELAARVNRFAGSLHGFGMHMEQRILLCLQDGIDFPTAFLGAIKAGMVPVPVNTLLSPADYAYMLQDSRAPMLGDLRAAAARLSSQSAAVSLSKHVLVAGATVPPPGMRSLDEVLASSTDSFASRRPRRRHATRRANCCIDWSSKGSAWIDEPISCQRTAIRIEESYDGSC